MAANDLTINQISTVLGEIVGQATGSKPMAVTDTSSFVTVAQIGLKTGYDTIATAISQVLSHTIFSKSASVNILKPPDFSHCIFDQ